MLLKSGFTLDQIVAAVLEVDHTKKLRIETLQRHGWERFMERTSRLPKGILNGVFTAGKMIAKPVQKTLQARSA
jgi:hypothetical protein